MESIPAPHQELIGARGGKPIGANDPFFADLNSNLADKGFLVAAADNLIAWARTGSLMWMQFGLACCAIEMMQVSMSRYDIERRFFGRLVAVEALFTGRRKRHRVARHANRVRC
jgi:hypothetical protein